MSTLSVLTFGSLFSGIGGLDLGLETAGWECRWQVEVDPWCQLVLAQHWPGVQRYGDVHRIATDDLERVDLICGGFPCQPVSVSGQRRASADDRWLWPEFARIIEGLGPRFVLIENVLGLRTAGLRDVLADLAALGFDAQWSPVSACSVGAPHLRRRLFVVAYRPGLGHEPFAGSPYGDEGTHEADPPLQSHQPGGDAADAGRAGWWASEPGVYELADGIPSKLARAANRALGNAVVPQVAQFVGERIMEAIDPPR